MKQIDYKQLYELLHVFAKLHTKDGIIRFNGKDFFDYVSEHYRISEGFKRLDRNFVSLFIGRNTYYYTFKRSGGRFMDIILIPRPIELRKKQGFYKYMSSL